MCGYLHEVYGLAEREDFKIFWRGMMSRLYLSRRYPFPIGDEIIIRHVWVSEHGYVLGKSDMVDFGGVSCGKLIPICNFDDLMAD